MLVAEVARRHLQTSDTQVLEELLQQWEADFPNTAEIMTSAIWLDMIKCSSEMEICPSPLVPSIKSLDEFHYNNKLFNLDGYIPEYELKADGYAQEALGDTFDTFSTTQSPWAANFMLRLFIHIFGDLHQPLHAANARSEEFPDGDEGGNSWEFEDDCEFHGESFSSLHALWDGVAGVYTVGWEVTFTPETRKELEEQATRLIDLHKLDKDPLNFKQLEDLGDLEFISEAKYLFQQLVNESNDIAANEVYTGLQHSKNDYSKLMCPDQEYYGKLVSICEKQIYLGGYRMATLLQRLADFAAQQELVKKRSCFSVFSFSFCYPSV